MPEVTENLVDPIVQLQTKLNILIQFGEIKNLN